MTRDQYMEAHHHITETQIGLARMHLSAGETDKAKEALDVCSVKLKGIYKERCIAMGIMSMGNAAQWLLGVVKMGTIKRVLHRCQ